jgi:hypothetical protein
MPQPALTPAEPPEATALAPAQMPQVLPALTCSTEVGLLHAREAGLPLPGAPGLLKCSPCCMEDAVLELLLEAEWPDECCG